MKHPALAILVGHAGTKFPGTSGPAAKAAHGGVAHEYEDADMHHMAAGGEADEADHGLEACAEDLIHAVHAEDPKAVAQALKDAFDILEMEPHEEYEEGESSES